MIKIEKNGLIFSFNENDGSFSLSDGTNVYNTVKAPVDYLFENAVSDGSVIECTIKRPESKQGELQLNEKAPDPYTMVKARFEYDDSLYPCIKLTMSSEAFFEKSFLYPPAFDAKAGQTHILPYNEGVAIDADDPNDDVSLYWYWGDSHNCCPDLMPLRDLFLNLYGLPPLFSFSVDNWDRLADKIERSYKNTSPLAKEVGYEKMTSFEYLSDDFSVQRTAFSNGVRVTVNFGDDDFTLADGRIVPAKGKIVERN